MVRSKAVYTCTEYGGTAPRWAGQCPNCQQWNTLVETVTQPTSGADARFQSLVSSATICRLSDIDAMGVPRFFSGIGEFGRVLGGGLVSGSVVLIGGDPGIGKSTLLLQTLFNLSIDRRMLYVSGEGSGSQIVLCARRLGIESPNLTLLTEVQFERIQVTIETERSEVVVIDSTQVLYSEVLTPAPDSVAQVRGCAAQLTRIARWLDVTTTLVGHVTKEGALAGPRVLEHIVDTVLYFEGDIHSAYRLVRAFKNRFGAVNRLGMFTMAEHGLHGVTNPSALFLSQHEQVVPSPCVLVAQEGMWPLLVEIRALAGTANVPNPRCLAVSLEQNRLAVLLAVLHRHTGTAYFDQDVFLNAMGDVKITEPTMGLAVPLAIHSPMHNKVLPRELMMFGETGLVGGICPTPRDQERLKEAAKLGFSIVVIPKSNVLRQAIDGLETIAVERIEQTIDRIRSLEA